MTPGAVMRAAKAMAEAFGEPEMAVGRDHKAARIVQPAEQDARIVERGPATHDTAARVMLHQIDAPVGSGMERAAVADKDGAVGGDSHRREAFQRFAFGFGEDASAASPVHGDEAALRARKQAAVGVECEGTDVAVEFREYGAIPVARAAKPPHLVSGGNADGAIRGFGDRIGTGKRLADRRRLFEPIIRTERAVHRRNCVRVAIFEEYLFEVAAQVREKAHRITLAACCPNRPRSPSRSDRNALDRA